MRKPVRQTAKRVLSIAGGKQVSLNCLKSLNFTLKVLAGDKLDGLRLRYANFCKGFRVHTQARLSFNDLESAKSDELNHLVFLYPDFDCVDHRRDCPFCLGLASFASELLLDCFD
jgi:hypothetical protein